MKPTILVAPVLAMAVTAFAAEIPPPADQIAAAVQAAPKDRRDAAAVLGYNAEGKLVTLRAGTNDLICLGDDPKVEGINVACYHKDLEPFMARGRELDAMGTKGQDRHKQRWKEVDDGKVKIPREPRMLYVLTGKSFDAASGAIAESYLRFVIYSPYATPECDGPVDRVRHRPWLMYPGTAGAHIMISPPKSK